jgi:hypothetical protein
MWWRRESGCSIQRIKLTIKNHISLSVNLYWMKKLSELDIKSGNWSYDMKYVKSQSLKSQCQRKIICGTSHEVKRKWSDKIQYLCKLKLKELILYLILSIDCALSRRIPHELPIKSQFSYSLKRQVRWVKHNDIIHYTSRWTRKNKIVQFFKPECPVFPVTAIF